MNTCSNCKVLIKLLYNKDGSPTSTMCDVCSFLIDDIGNLEDFLSEDAYNPDYIEYNSEQEPIELLDLLLQNGSRTKPVFYD